MPADKPTIEFVNDWSELEEAVEKLWGYFNSEDPGSADDYCTLDPDIGEPIIKYVPRLLTQYASLLEMSFDLAELVRKQHELAPKTGLYLPDHR